MKALQLIGQLFEVGAFLERKETTIVHKSADIRARLLDRLGRVSDVTAKPSDALELLEEIRGTGTSEAAGGAPTAGAPPLEAVPAMGALSHTVSLIQTPEKKEWGASKNQDDTVLDFDKE
jgi:hypothetical protein